MTSDTTAGPPARDRTRPRIDFDVVVLDTPDLSGLARFYADLLGWTITARDEDWWTVDGGTGARISFQLAPDHKPPTWPDNTIPQQIHLDLRVDDLEAAAAYAESLGARRVTEARDGFIALLDPSGHPFCVCD